MKRIMLAACILLVIIAVGCGKKLEGDSDCDNNDCLISKAVLNSDTKICDGMKNNPTPMDDICYRAVLRNSQDYEKCYEELYEFESGRYTDELLEQDVVEGCNFMITQERLYMKGDDACLEKPAGWNSDIYEDWEEYCELIKETILTDEKDCENLVNENNHEKDQCLYELSKFRKDQSICDKIELDNLKSSCMDNIK